MNRIFAETADYARAELIDVMSGVVTRFPSLRHISENLDSPSHVSARWRHSSVPAAAITNWVSYAGIAESGRRPKDYPEAAILGISKEEVDAYAAEHGGQHAVAYVLGSRVIIGTMLEDEIFGVSEDGEQYRVAMGIGKGVLQATAGLYLPHKRLWVPSAPIEDMGRMPADQVPVTVPFL